MNGFPHMSFPRVDIHPHIVSPDTERYPMAPLGGKRSDWSKSAHSLTAEELVAVMDESGVAKAALVHSSTTYGFDNSLVADAVAQFPDRLTAALSDRRPRSRRCRDVEVLARQGLHGPALLLPPAARCPGRPNG